jgi:predicted metalloprotease with PDZ domain
MRRLPLFLLMVAMLPAPGGFAAANPTEPAVVQLPRYEVRERKGISEFGLSIVTNFGVIFGGRVKWMRVGQVVAGSSAALAGLQSDDEVMSIDGLKVTEFHRRQMLEKFFGRAPGASLVLLIRAKSRDLRQVRLTTAVRPGS